MIRNTNTIFEVYLIKNSKNNSYKYLNSEMSK